MKNFRKLNELREDLHNKQNLRDKLQSILNDMQRDIDLKSEQIGTEIKRLRKLGIN